MAEKPTDRCGYTWPEDHEIGDDPCRQNCCYRKTKPENERCAWHSEKSDVKSIGNLREVRVSDKIRDEYGELIDGANLSKLQLEDALQFNNTVLRNADLSHSNFKKADFSAAVLIGADLSHSNFTYAEMYNCVLDDADLSYSSVKEARLGDSSLCQTHLFKTNLVGADFMDAVLDSAFIDGADFSNTRLQRASLESVYSGGMDPGMNVVFENVDLRYADLTGVKFKNIDFSGSIINRTDFSNTTFSGVDFTDVEARECDFTNADFSGADFSRSNLSESRFCKANLENSVLRDVNLFGCDLRDCRAHGAEFTGAQINDATKFHHHTHNDPLWKKTVSLPRCVYDPNNPDTKYKSKKEKIRLSEEDMEENGVFESESSSGEESSGTNPSWDVDEGTFHSIDNASSIRINKFGTSSVDGWTPEKRKETLEINWESDATNEDAIEGEPEPPTWRQEGWESDATDEDAIEGDWETHLKKEVVDEQTVLTKLSKAADTYQSFEKLARENARPSLQSEMFVLRQDMQRKRHWHNSEYFEWSFARVSRVVFKYGESLARIVMSAVAIIIAYAILYAQFGFIVNEEGTVIESPVDVLYFSTLTFTTLGLGDFKPEPASEIARLLVTSQAAIGAILIAVFVFVLGRRAAK